MTACKYAFNEFRSEDFSVPEYNSKETLLSLPKDMPNEKRSLIELLIKNGFEVRLEEVQKIFHQNQNGRQHGSCALASYQAMGFLLNS